MERFVMMELITEKQDTVMLVVVHKQNIVEMERKIMEKLVIQKTQLNHDGEMVDVAIFVNQLQ